MKSANEYLTIPTRQHVQKLVLGRYNSEKTKLKELLIKIDSKIAFTTDVWISPAQKPFIEGFVSGRCIDDELRGMMLTSWELEVGESFKDFREVHGQ